ncbi:MAG: aldehyde dehydrogenase family protein [Armatimonadetes bacterium]|nr:aldehyde dehydrogenase family protein [Armatimonadota bacterium]MDE2205753.1 aldehyde dehydrogenase family protein [Armatimonadota bacterium]
MNQSVIPVVNPFDGSSLGEVPRMDATEVDAAIGRATAVLPALAQLPAFERAGILSRTAASLRSNAPDLAAGIVRETGKTIREAAAEVGRAAGIFDFAAGEAQRLHGETVPFDAFPNGVGRVGWWIREPVGVVAAIVPWNVPLALAAHKVAPALAAGCPVIIKPAEQTPFNAIELHRALAEAGAPVDSVQVVTGLGDEAGAALVRHPGISFVSFTGSHEVGMQIPAKAGYKRVALELGGNSPALVMPSANIAAAAKGIVSGGFAVAGQLCISVQRVIVHEAAAAALVQSLLPLVAALNVGDPMDPATDVGTLIDQPACNRVAALVDSARAAGARMLVGGSRIGYGAFLPTVLSEVSRETPAAVDEAFAPLVMVMVCRSLEDGIALANATPYGLNAGIYTADVHEAFRAIRELKFGSVMINDTPSFRSDLMPYGGRKQSGLGREGVRFAMEEMTEMKVVCFNL